MIVSPGDPVAAAVGPVTTAAPAGASGWIRGDTVAVRSSDPMMTNSGRGEAIGTTATALKVTAANPAAR